ncbi:MAG: DNA topoisomerase IB [Longimicrobiales bacterium]
MPDEASWWRREPLGRDRGFRYLKVGGGELTSETALSRIRRLAIPPAWTDVHISPDPSRKVQAWGRDAAGRKQYRYSPAHEEDRDMRRWKRVLKFARELPELRAVTNAHLRLEGLGQEKVLATIVRLMGRGYFRVGSERYAVENKTFGICTLGKRHLEVVGNDLVFTYKGKQRIDQRRVVASTPLVEILDELLELPGRRLFQYLDAAGRRRPIGATEVNRYLCDVLGEKYTSKDFRTFGGTVRAATILADVGPARTAREAEKTVVMTCKLVASELGNTPAIARKAYIHPVIFDEYVENARTIEPLMRARERPVPAEAPPQYYPEEGALIRFLEKYG